MTDKELITKLKDYDLSPEIATIIAERMKQLIALAENGQSAIDTNKKLSEKLIMAIEDLKKVLNNEEDTCKLCVHYIECKGKECKKYSEFNEAIDENGKVIPWKGDCLELNWGDCPMQDDKPCKDCFNMDKFMWRGEEK